MARGIGVNGLCRGLADGGGCPVWGGGVHGGGRLVSGAGDWGRQVVSRRLRAGRNGCPLWEGESTREGGWSMARGIWVNGLCHGLADGNGWSALGGESPRGREAVNGAGIWVNGLCRELADGDGCPLWEGESPRGRQSKPDMSPRIHD